MYRDKAKQRDANRERVRRYREKKGVTSLLTSEGVTSYPQGVTEHTIDKLTDPAWRKRMTQWCDAFANSHHPEYANDVRFGVYGPTLADLSGLLDCTAG